MIIRIRSDIPNSWGFYPAFEKRVLDSAMRHDIPMNEAVVMQELRNRFLNMPIASGYWLFAGREEIYGHACAYLSTNFGIMSVFFLQLEAEFSPEEKREWTERHVNPWLAEIEGALGKVPYLPREAQQITRMEFLTARDGEAFRGWLERLGYTVERSLTLLQFSRKAETRKPALLS